jgi:hypothetical protein
MTMEAQSSVYMNTETAAIDDLVISDKLKEKFHLIREHCTRIRFGVPEYDVQTYQFRITMMSFWALIFVVFYYLAKGMYKKAGSLFALSLVCSIPGCFIDPMFSGLGLIPAILAAYSAYSDLYRTYVLKEDFWW